MLVTFFWLNIVASCDAVHTEQLQSLPSPCNFLTGNAGDSSTAKALSDLEHAIKTGSLRLAQWSELVPWDVAGAAAETGFLFVTRWGIQVSLNKSTFHLTAFPAASVFKHTLALPTR